MCAGWSKNFFSGEGAKDTKDGTVEQYTRDSKGARLENSIPSEGAGETHYLCSETGTYTSSGSGEEIKETVQNTGESK